MPLYEYRCHSCGRTFEIIQKFSDEPVKTDPECGGEVERLFSAPAFHLKGTGWYATDYAKKSSPSAAKTDDHKPEAKAKTDSGGEGSSAGSSSSSNGSPAEGKPAGTESKPGQSPSPAPAATADK